MVYKGIRRYTEGYKDIQQGSELCHYLVEVSSLQRGDTFSSDTHLYTIADEFPVTDDIYLLWVRFSVEEKIDANFIVAVDIPPYLDAPVVEVADMCVVGSREKRHREPW